MNRAGPARRILGNFFNLSAGELIARLVSFAAFAHLARVLGSTEFGRIGFVMTVVTYLLIPVLQGFDSVGIRDVSRDRSLARRYAGNILSMRLLSALITWILLAVVVSLIAPSPVLRALLLLFGLTLLPSAASLKWAFQAVEHTRPVAVAGIVAQLGFAAGAFTVGGPDQLLLVPLYLLAGESIGAIVLAVVFVRLFGGLRLGFEWRFWRVLFRESLPLAAATVLGTLLFNFDVLALAYFQSPAAVGLYTAVYKLVVLFYTPLTLFQLSVFPTLSRSYSEGAGLQTTAAPAIRYLAAVFLPVPFAGMMMAAPILAFLFGAEYVPGAATLQILLWSLPLMALRSFFRILLVSYNLQRLDLRTVLAGALTNIAVDLALVPRFGTVGAAVGTLSSEAVILFLSYTYVRRRIGFLPVGKHCLRPLAASILMLAAVWSLSTAPLAVLIAVAAAIYVAALFLLRAVTWKEIAAAYRG